MVLLLSNLQRRFGVLFRPKVPRFSQLSFLAVRKSLPARQAVTLSGLQGLYSYPGCANILFLVGAVLLEPERNALLKPAKRKPGVFNQLVR